MYFSHLLLYAVDSRAEIHIYVKHSLQTEVKGQGQPIATSSVWDLTSYKTTSAAVHYITLLTCFTSYVSGFMFQQLSSCCFQTKVRSDLCSVWKKRSGNERIMDSLDSAGDLLRFIRTGLFTEPRWALGPFIILHSVEKKYNHLTKTKWEKKTKLHLR